MYPVQAFSFEFDGKQNEVSSILQKVLIRSIAVTLKANSSAWRATSQ